MISKLEVSKQSFYREVMELAFNFKAGIKDTAGNEIKFQAQYSPHWKSLYLSQYTTHTNEIGDCVVTVIRNENVNFKYDLKTQEDFDRISKDILDWMKPLCTRGAVQRTKAFVDSHL